MNATNFTQNEIRARAAKQQGGQARPANSALHHKRTRPAQSVNSHEDDDQWSGATRGRFVFHRKIKRFFRLTGRRIWRSLMTIISSPIVLQRWVVVVFILAALSTIIVDGISLSMGFSNLLER
ncbi:MAG: hypothetical protein O7D91_18790 [Planctomycetota bacterium]|nr:hypothetical protein [Planctomycetota bacterium]